MEKLIKLANAIGPRIESKRTPTSGEIYAHLKKDVFLSQIMKRLSASETIYLTFLILGYKEGRELKVVLEEILSNLFSFSVIYVSDEQPYTSCSFCGGDGSYDCGMCEGEGDVECDTCDGSGEDGEGETCDDCDGSGRLDCQHCSSGQEECDVCDGSGEVEDEYLNHVSQNDYFSIDTKLLQKLELLSEYDKIEDGDDFPSNTFKTYEFWGDSGDFDGYGENVFLLGELNTNPSIQKTSDGIRDNELKDYVQ